MKYLCLLLINLYQRVISPLIPARCRFYPTCSSYFHEAVSRYGVIKGLKMGIIRVLKCHPFHPGGYDPVK